MGKDILVSVDVDVEEGEISDSASVEEISAEGFTAKAAPVIRSEIAVGSKQQQQQQVWTMDDLVKYQKNYQMSRNYAPGLYNFAWAQAVQNKPLDNYVTKTTIIDNESKRMDDNDKIVVDVSGDDSEKEEGELEESEIDLVTDVVDDGKEDGGEEVSNVEKWIEVIRVGLEGITVNDANKSLSGVCSRLEDMLDSLSTLISENSVSNKDDWFSWHFFMFVLLIPIFIMF